MDIGLITILVGLAYVVIGAIIGLSSHAKIGSNSTAAGAVIAFAVCLIAWPVVLCFWIWEFLKGTNG